MTDLNVVVVGGGLAGLSCARHLHAAGVEVILLEAEAEIGGRVRTDRVDGFLLDHGFQVLLTAYPECQRQLDYDDLDLQNFAPGARVRYGGRFHTVADPWRHPVAGLLGAFTPIGSLSDKLRVARLRQRLLASDLEEVFSRPEVTTLAALEREGFSPAMVERFFRPFLAGIFLERDLATSSRMFEFVFKMFSSGSAALPAQGMQAIPKQLARSLPEAVIRTGAKVVGLERGRVKLESGESVEADAVVLATASSDSATLAGELTPISWCSTTCLYYAVAQCPFDQPMLMLNGEVRGPINNLCVPSRVARGYAPPNRDLVSVSVVGTSADGSETEAELENSVRKQLREWFGSSVDAWELLRIYRIPRALPRQSPPALEPAERPVRIADRLYACGDHRDNASIQGAMISGRRAAEALLADFGTS
ncbi:MAG: NAD(P)/FAD-dependent oxidoreductase [Acidobacteriota bacterium]